MKDMNMRKNIIFVFLMWAGQVLAIIPTGELSQNQLSVAQYLNTVTGNPTLITQINVLSALGSSQLQDAMNNISPSRLGNTAFAIDNNHFEFNQIITQRLQMHRYQSTFRKMHSEMAFLHEEDLIAYYDAKKKQSIFTSRKRRNQNSVLPYALWITGFGQLAHESVQNQDPAFDIRTGGVYLGFDTLDVDSFYLSTGFGYSDTDTCQDHGSSIDNYTLSFYSMYYQKNLFLEMGLLGSFNTYSNRRCIMYPGFLAVAHSKHEGFQLGPHVGFGYDFLFAWGAVEPYISIDWVYLYENSYTESGAAPFNMQVDSRNSLMLRSEIALQSYQILKLSHGFFVFKELVSYVNKKPYNVGTIQSFLTGAQGNLIVSALNEVQNLFCGGAEIFYRGKKNLFISFATSGEFGGDYSMVEVQGKLGKYF